MPPFRWPEVRHDLALAREVLQNAPEKPTEWEGIAESLSTFFTSWASSSVEIKGRGCRERMDRLLEKHKRNEAKALKRSGTEEEFSELTQLLEDIYTYRRDMKDIKEKEKETKKQKEKSDREKGEEMRAAALSRMAKRKKEKRKDSSSEEEEEEEDDSYDENDAPDDESDDDDDDDDDKERTPSHSKKGKKPKKRVRASKASAIDMLRDKYARKAKLKNKELELRKMELEFQKQKYADEVEERKAKTQSELEERKVMFDILKKNVYDAQPNIPFD